MPQSIPYEPIMDQKLSQELSKGLLGNRVISALINELERTPVANIVLNGKITVIKPGNETEVRDYWLRDADIQRLFSFLYDRLDRAAEVMRLEITGCNLQVFSELDNQPSFFKLMGLNLKNNGLKDFIYNNELAPNLKILNLAGNSLAQVDLSESNTLEMASVSSNPKLKVFVPPQTSDLTLRVPSYTNLTREFYEWIGVRINEPALNVNPKINFLGLEPTQTVAPSAGAADEYDSDAPPSEAEEEEEQASKKARPASPPRPRNNRS